MKRGALVRGVFLGVAIGSLLTFSPGTLFILLCVGFTCLLLVRCVASQERRFILGLFLTGFFIRMALSVGLDAAMWIASKGEVFRTEPTEHLGVERKVDESRTFFRVGDSDYYTNRSLSLAHYAQGRRDGQAKWARFSYYGRGGHLYPMAFFHYLFGFSPVAIKLINCFWGGLLGPFVYLLGKAAFHPVIGRWAGVSNAFFPSLVFWSTSNLKDTSLIVLGVVLLLLFYRMAQGVSSKQDLWLKSGILCVALWAHMSMRDPIFGLSFLMCIGAYFWCLLPIRKDVKILCFLGGLAGLALLHSVFEKLLLKGFVFHIGHARTFPGIPYFYLPEEYYLQGLPSQIHWNGAFLFALVRAVYHYLLEPLPLQVGSYMRVAAIPQLAFWMTAFLFALYGVWAVFRRKQWKILPLLMVTAIWTFLGAVTNGNVGTVFRMRDMVTPFYLILASAGFWFLAQRSPARSSVA